ncbi:MAG: hypothetical protein Q4F13_02730 [Pseudomonadota bacterium]|nr:hypothetical protein [Pseudomonadota bacterium]
MSHISSENVTPAAKKKSAGAVAPDWERIELDYRAGVKTLREIAAENGVSHTLVNRRAKKDCWSRDLSAKIQAKADELVSKQSVSSSVSTVSKLIEREVVEANAQQAAHVRLSQRKDIARMRGIADKLMAELELQADAQTVQMLGQLGELMAAPDDKGMDKLGELYRKVISLPERTKTAKTLAETLRIAVDMERQAFGMDAKEAAAPPGVAGNGAPAIAVIHVAPPADGGRV